MTFARSVVAVTASFALLASAFASKSYAEAKEMCYEKGARCAGAKGHPYVKYAPCCDKEMVCAEDKEMGWGRFCKTPSSKYWEKCYLNGSRCMGAPGKPYVEYHKCCGNGSCVEDKELGWGKFCKHGKYDTKYEKVYKEAKEEYKPEEKEQKGKMYKGHYYESKDGKMKYESYLKSTMAPTTTMGYPKSYGGMPMNKGTNKFGKKIKPAICKVGGGSVASGCFETPPTVADAAEYNVAALVPDCKGDFPCDAARAVRDQICSLFGFSSTRLCYLLGSSLELPAGLMRSTRTLSLRQATVRQETVPGFRFVVVQIAIKCFEFTPAAENAADRTARLFYGYSKNKMLCTTPTITP